MYNVKHKLTAKQQEELFIKLARSLSLLQGPVEIAEFIKDLISESEVYMLARRLQIAELLIEGETYEQIREALKVGQSTIARVQLWLELYGDGYRNAVKKINKGKKEDTDDNQKPFALLKKKYPAYFWPQLLLEELVKTANRREKDRIKKVIDQLQEKTQLSKQLTKLLQ